MVTWNPWTGQGDCMRFPGEDHSEGYYNFSKEIAQYIGTPKKGRLRLKPRVRRYFKRVYVIKET